MTLHSNPSERDAPRPEGPTGPGRGESAARGTFFDELSRLEQRASAPPVIGEVMEWCRRMRRALDHLIGPQGDLSARHAEIRRELAREDPQLSARLHDLARRESSIADSLHDLATEAEQLEEACRADRPDEPLERARDLRIQLLAWCVAARALEGELQTTFMEAHYRDRGRVD